MTEYGLFKSNFVLKGKLPIFSTFSTTSTEVSGSDLEAVEAEEYLFSSSIDCFANSLEMVGFTIGLSLLSSGFSLSRN